MSLQARLDQITQSTRKLVQPERLALSEKLLEDLLHTGIEDRVLPVGSQAPAFDLPDAVTGQRVRSADLLALGPLIVSFFRGRWDPYCVTELETWRDLYAQVRQRGALLVGLSPETLRQSEFAAMQHHIPYPLLHDANSGVAEQFGIAYDLTPDAQRYYRSILVNIPFLNGGRNVMAADDTHVWRLPLPATFVISQSNQIVYSEAHADFRVRPEPEDVLHALNTSAGSLGIG